MIGTRLRNMLKNDNSTNSVGLKTIKSSQVVRIGSWLAGGWLVWWLEGGKGLSVMGECG